MRIPNQSVGMRWTGLVRPDRGHVVANRVMRRVISQRPNLPGDFEADPSLCYDRCLLESLICERNCPFDPEALLYDVCYYVCQQIYWNCTKNC